VPDKLPPHEQYIVDVLLNCATGSSLSKDQKDRGQMAATPAGIQPCPPNQKGVPLIIPALLSTVEGISHIRLHLPRDLKHEAGRETVWKSVLEVQRRFPDGITLLDPVKNMGIKDEKFVALVKVSLVPFQM